jgi:predicted nucleic acid-binding Zn finger protein
MLHEDASCRFVVVGRKCDIVLGKGWHCACGHDLEWGRVVARQRFEDHVLGALAAGANADQVSRTIILPMYDHLRVAQGQEGMPACIFSWARCGTHGSN